MLNAEGKDSTKKRQFTAFALLFNTISWFFLSRFTLQKIGDGFNNGSSLELAYSSAIVVSAIVACIFLVRVSRIKLIYSWLILGTLASLCLAIPTGSSFGLTIAVASLLGISVGIGTPTCFSYFTESISVQNRGKVGGIILFATICTVPAGMVIAPLLDLTISSVVLAAWRAWSLPLMLLVSEKENSFLSTDLNVTSIMSVLRNRTFYLYFAAWLMFCLVDSFESVVVGTSIETLGFNVRILEPIFTGLSAIVAGTVSDWGGRRRVLIFGFVSLGVAYATIGLFSQVWVAWLFYSIIDGIALGLLWVIFVFVLWGDLSEKNSERFYAIGETPFFLTYIFSIILAPYVTLVPTAGSFSLAAFFLFVAIIPLFYAPETLPEKNIKDRELRQYVEKAKKTKDKLT